MDRRFLFETFALLTMMSIVVSCRNKHVDAKCEKEMVVEVVESKQLPSPTTSFQYVVVDKKESTLIVADNQKVEEFKKMTYTIDIPNEYPVYALDEIADVIAYSEPCDYVFVEYYLPAQVKNSYNYGLSKRTPTERDTQINYIAPPQIEQPIELNEAVKAPYDGCKVYGKWNMHGAVLVVYKKNNTCYMVNYYGGSNYGEPERYIKTTFRGCTAFKNAEDPNDVYVINDDGNLDGYYEGDLACTFSKAL